VVGGSEPILVHNCDVDLYHGTGKRAAASIRASGVDPNYPPTYPRDFGDGFYTTRSRAQAEEWAEANNGSDGEVLHFRIPKSELDSLNGKSYDSDSPELLDFLRM
jgi:hypothetical protein